MPSPADAPYSGLPPSGMLVISVPAAGSMTVEECASPLKVKTRFEARVVDDRVGVLRGGNAAEHLERLQVEHHDGLIVARRGEPVARVSRRSPSRARLDAGDLAEQLARVLVDDHHAILPAR